MDTVMVIPPGAARLFSREYRAMSPVSSSQVSDPAAARVQVPFTLSDTRTSPGALYWLNHPTSRSPWATGRLSATVVDGIRGVENATPWMKVGVATAGRGSRAPRVAIRARPPEERAEGRCFSMLPVLGAHGRNVSSPPAGRWATLTCRVILAAPACTPPFLTPSREAKACGMSGQPASCPAAHAWMANPPPRPVGLRLD